jgi:hypothetical protein
MENFAIKVVNDIISDITKNFTFSKINPIVPLKAFDDLFFKTRYSKDELLCKRIEYLSNDTFGYDDDLLVKIVIDPDAIFYRKGKYYYISIKDILITCVVLEKSGYLTRYDKRYIESGRSLNEVFLNFKDYKYHEDIFYTFDTMLMQLLRGFCSAVPYKKIIKLPN